MQPGAKFRLVVRRGPQPNHQYELVRDTITLGRDITNDIVINDPEVSRHHARLTRTASGYELEDLRSTNGTFVNRHRIKAAQPLSGGDQIGFGETVTLTFEVVDASAAATLVGSGAGAGFQQPPIQQPSPQMPSAPAQQPYPQQAPAQQPYPGGQAEYAPVQPYDQAGDGSDRNRWIVIGCAGLTLVFCCVLLAAAIIIDQQELYCDIPVMNAIDFFCIVQ